MKINRIFGTAVLAVVVGAVTMLTAQAAFIAGGIGFSGIATLDDVPATATRFDFTNPGSVVSVSGDFGSVPILISPGQPDTTVYFTNFVFGAPGTLGLLSVNPLWTLNSGGQIYSFRLDNIGVNQFDGTERLLQGDGMASISGGAYTATPGRWSLRASGTGTTITFSSSTAVPDGGASVVLLGMSLLGLLGGHRLLTRSGGPE